MSAGPFNLREIHAIHTRFSILNDNELTAAAEEAGEIGEHYVHERPKFKPRTGDLQAATEHKVIRTKRGRVIRLLNPKKYAAAIDKGARPHGIVARRAPLLIFFWQKIGQWVATKRVQHPGNKPYRFLHDATWVAGRSFLSTMRARMERIASRF
jgi:hypothetical protein